MGPPYCIVHLLSFGTPANASLPQRVRLSSLSQAPRASVWVPRAGWQYSSYVPSLAALPESLTVTVRWSEGRGSSGIGAVTEGEPMATSAGAAGVAVAAGVAAAIGPVRARAAVAVMVAVVAAVAKRDSRGAASRTPGGVGTGPGAVRKRFRRDPSRPRSV